MYSNLWGFYYSLAMNSDHKNDPKLEPGRLVEVWGFDPDYHSYVGTGIVINTKQFCWTQPLEVLVMIGSTYSWYDMKTFAFFEPEQRNGH